MPCYDYDCRSCGVIELVQKMRDEPYRRCPICGSPCQRVILQPPSFQSEGDWASENGGRGRRIGQMEDTPHERKYYKSKSALTEDCRKKGYEWD